MNFSIFSSEKILCILHGQVFMMNQKKIWQFELEQTDHGDQKCPVFGIMFSALSHIF